VRWILAQIPLEYSDAKPAPSSSKTAVIHKN